MLNILILNILKEYSDENHRLTQQEIIRLLKTNYDMECDRRSVKNNILSLKELGYEISVDDGYYLMGKEFDDAELRMLIDSVLFSKNLTQRQAKVLIDKLCGFGNRYFSAKVTHVSNLPEMNHTDNKQMLYSLDAINDAIAENKKISFIYNDYKIDFKLHPRREEVYIVNPYQLVANNGRFYLIGNYDKYDNISHYRVDKMTNVKILEQRAKAKKEIVEFAKGYNLPKHMAEHIYMFGGESVKVKFHTQESMMSEMIDWFGKDFRVRRLDNRGEIEITVNCNKNAIFFWALQYGPYVEIVEPEDIRNRIKKCIIEMYKKYET